MLGYIILAIVVLLAIYLLSTYNSLAKLKVRVEEGFSTMDIYLKKRWSLIPNLVETVKGYMKHEKELLTELTKLRETSYDKMNMSDKVTSNDKLSHEITKTMAVAENYPELKSSSNFIDLSNQLAKIEEDIANARKYYNGTVRNYNDKIVTFPSGMIAKLFGFKQEKMFEASTEEREDVNINI